MSDLDCLDTSGYYLKLPADTKELHKMIDFLKSDMNEHSVSEKKQFQLTMAAEEIFANISSYAYQENGMVEITTFIQDRTYCVRFADNGKKYNPLQHEDPDITADLKDRPIGGLGIFLAKKLSDKICYSYENEHNILIIGVDL